MASEGRLAALEVVTRVRDRGAYAHETLNAVLSRSVLTDRDRSLATRLSYGTVATRGSVDAVVDRALRPGTVLTPRVSDALAIGAYEVLFARTPAHAAVSETVELVRAVEPKAAGLANAVMRSLVRLKESFPFGDPDTDTCALALAEGHPEWLVARLSERFGAAATREILRSNNEAAPLYVVALDPEAQEQLMAASADEVSIFAPSVLPRSFVARVPALATRVPVVVNRHALVMDLGAQFAVEALHVEPGQVVVEIGAGRGGKSLLAASHARAHGAPLARLVAIDSHGFKLERLEADAVRLGFDEIEVLEADACGDVSSAVPMLADRVLVDAPCSGLGTLRRHPDMRWRISPREIEALGALDSALLASAARLVKVGGFMVYSTCTLTQEENSDVISRFLHSDEGRSFEISSLAQDVPDAWDPYIGADGTFQSVPSSGSLDGHFVARLRRTR